MANELMVDMLRGNVGILKMTLADMSDKDMLQRPVPGANNGLWQLGHLINAEAAMVNACAQEALIELPAGFDKKYSKETASVDDPALLGKKDELLAIFEKNREKNCSWVATLTPADLAKPAPERLKRMCATVGHVVNLFPMHVAMHVGQFQVLRRKLGKPILF